MAGEKIKLNTAINIVIANMIGTGVFTSLGFQVMEIHSVFALLTLWLIGGIVALCGAICYSHLSVMMPQSGSEYNYLSKIFHPSIGFASGWVSSTVGFAAPVALSAVLLGKYLNKTMGGLDEKLIAISFIVLVSLIHIQSIKLSSRFQNVFTVLKLLLIVTIVFCGLFSSNHQDISILPTGYSLTEIVSPAFAIGLFWVSYSYSGWNGSTYLAGEIEDPKQNVPRSLLIGTGIVTILYVLLNFTFLYTTSQNQLSGQPEIGYIVAVNIFGISGGKLISGIIAILLISSISSMVLAGPRVSQRMGQDHSFLKIFASTNQQNIPHAAIIFQSFISILLIITSTFEQVLIYTGFTLNLLTFLTVLGLIKAKLQHANGLSWNWALPALVFLLITGWILAYGLYLRTTESALGLLTALSGLVIYAIGRLRT